MAAPELFDPLRAPGVPGQAGPYGGINPGGGQPQTAPGPVLPKTPAGPYGGINQAGGTTAPAPAPKPTDPVSATQPVPVTGPTTPAPTAAAPDQGGIAQFQSWAQSRYGRQATPEELQQIAQQIGYTGGALSPDMLTRAQGAADTLARAQGWQGPATPETPPVVSGGGGQEVQSELQRRLLEMLGRNTGDVDTTSQEYQSQYGAFRRGQGRAIEQAKRAAAERMGPGGGMDAALQTLDLEAAGREGDFTAQLAGQQIARQREDLTNALQMAQQGGLATEARMLQDRLGSQDLDLRRYLGRGQLGLGLLGTLLGNEQARNALGFNYASLNNSANQQALQTLLGGL